MSIETLTKKQLIEIIKELKKKTSVLEHTSEVAAEEGQTMSNEACGIYRDVKGDTHYVTIRFDEQSKKAVVVEDEILPIHIAESKAIKFIVRTNRGLHV